MSYAELAQYGRLRKPGCCGPYSMFMKLAHTWGRERDLTPQEVAKKVKLFFRYDSIYRQYLMKPILLTDFPAGSQCTAFNCGQVLLDQSAQNDDPDPELSCRGLQPGRQQVRPPALPL